MEPEYPFLVGTVATIAACPPQLAFNTSATGVGSVSIDHTAPSAKVDHTSIPNRKEKSLQRNPESAMDTEVKQDKEVKQLFDRLAQAEEADLTFLVDCTGSMQPFITDVKEIIHDTVAGLKKRFPHLQLRLAFVGYRDFLPKANTCELLASTHEVLDFTEDVQTFKNFVSGVVARGGNDTPEDVFGGLEAAAKLSWQQMSRVIFHIADAPCHGAQYHDLGNDDNYPDGDPLRRSLTALLQSLYGDAQVNTYHFAHVNSKCQKMLSEFRKVCGVPDWIHESYLTLQEEEKVCFRRPPWSEDLIGLRTLGVGFPAHPGDFPGEFPGEFPREFPGEFPREFPREFLREFPREFLRDAPRAFFTASVTGAVECSLDKTFFSMAPRDPFASSRDVVDADSVIPTGTPLAASFVPHKTPTS